MLQMIFYSFSFLDAVISGTQKSGALECALKSHENIFSGRGFRFYKVNRGRQIIVAVFSDYLLILSQNVTVCKWIRAKETIEAWFKCTKARTLGVKTAGDHFQFVATRQQDSLLIRANRENNHWYHRVYKRTAAWRCPYQYQTQPSAHTATRLPITRMRPSCLTCCRHTAASLNKQQPVGLKRISCTWNPTRCTGVMYKHADTGSGNFSATLNQHQN